MHSGDKRQYLTTSDITMLRRVLDKAGLPDSAEHPLYEKREPAARLLIALFEQGITVEDKLTDALQASMAASTPMTGPGDQTANEPALSRPAMTVSAAGGYRYGRRVERNGTWTIYHVFSGIPAEYAAWKMVGLNVKTAARALKILNAPASLHATP